MTKISGITTRIEAGPTLDALMEIEKADGTSRRALISDLNAGPGLKIPLLSDFPTWLNQGGATASDNTFGILLNEVTPGTADQIRMRYRSVPGGNWTITTKLVRGWHYRNYVFGGMGFRESATSKLLLLGIGHPNAGPLMLSYWTGPTAFASNPVSGMSGLNAHDEIFFRVVYDGTNYKFQYAVGRGEVFITLITEAKNAHFTTAADQWGFFINANDQDATRHEVGMACLGWLEA